MSITLQAVIRAMPGKVTLLLDLLTQELIPLMEAQGWKLVGCYSGRTGPINTIIDLWELEDMEHFRRAYQGFVAHPAYPSIRERLDRFVQEETLTFLDRKI